MAGRAVWDIVLAAGRHVFSRRQLHLVRKKFGQPEVGVRILPSCAGFAHPAIERA